jgi:hypothetical protein
MRILHGEQIKQREHEAGAARNEKCMAPAEQQNQRCDRERRDETADVVRRHQQRGHLRTIRSRHRFGDALDGRAGITAFAQTEDETDRDQRGERPREAGHQSEQRPECHRDDDDLLAAPAVGDPAAGNLHGGIADIERAHDDAERGRADMKLLADGNERERDRRAVDV